MAYIGNLPATGQNNSFRLLDDITSYTLTFDGSSASVVNSSDKTIESANHRFVQGQRVVYAAGGGTPVANLTGGTAYFIIKQGGSHFQLATSATNASNGVAISISAAGSATGHTLIASFDAVNTRFMASHSGGTKVNITRSAQLNISINGVIQEPQETASPTAGFGRDSGSVIVFSTAPNAGDAFWGSLVADNVPTFDISDNDVDNFTGDDSTTDFTLSKTPPDNRNILVTLDGVTQHPSDNTTTRAYSVTENILSFTSAPNTSVSIQVRHIGFAGATGGGSGVTNFYGRTGSVVLKNTDTINVANIVDEGYLAVGSTASFGGNVSIGGTLTYDDVTYVEAVGLSTFKEGIFIPDNKKIELGNAAGSGDLQIYHSTASGGNSIINDSGTGNLIIGGSIVEIKNAALSQTQATFTQGGDVQLFSSGNEKFKTIGYGVTVVGAMQVSGMTTFFNDTTIKNGGYHRGIINSGAQAKIIGGYISGTDTLRLGESMYLTSTGLGIGTATPGSLLEVTSDSPKIVLKDTDNNSEIYLHNVGGAAVLNSANSDIAFQTPTKELVRFQSTGNVGIGTHTPGKLLEIFGTDPTIKLRDSSGDAYALIEGDSADQGSIRFRADPLSAGAATHIRFDIDGTERLRITGAGITVTGEVAASQDYPNFRPTLDFNFAAEKKLDPRITYKRTGVASFVNEFGLVKIVGDNVPRFDHDPITRECKGLLIESNRVNLAESSEDFGNTSFWVPTSQTITRNVATAPDGTLTADNIVPASGTDALRYLYFSGSAYPMSADTTYTTSIFVKKNGLRYFALQAHDNASGSGHRAGFDLDNGTVVTSNNMGSASNHSASIVEFPNGWFRCILTGTTASSGTTGKTAFSFSSALDSNASVAAITADGSSGGYAWGHQAEAGAFETSYIPTTSGTEETRGADLVEITEEEFSEFYNRTEGSFASEIMLKPSFPVSGFASIMMTLSDSSYNNRVTLSSSTGSAVFNADVSIGGTLNRAILGSYTSGSHSIKAAMAYKAADSAGSLNGAAAVTTSPSGTLPLLTRADIGKDHGDFNPLNGHVKRLMYYSKRLSNNQLRTLTS